MPKIVDRRSEERIIARVDATIHDGEDFVAPATIIDLTARGARLRTSARVSLPRRFSLRFHNGHETEVNRLWRIDDQVGVIFVEPALDAQSFMRSIEAKDGVLEWRTDLV